MRETLFEQIKVLTKVINLIKFLTKYDNDTDDDTATCNIFGALPWR